MSNHLSTKPALETIFKRINDQATALLEQLTKLSQDHTELEANAEFQLLIESIGSLHQSSQADIPENIEKVMNDDEYISGGKAYSLTTIILQIINQLPHGHLLLNTMTEYLIDPSESTLLEHIIGQMFLIDKLKPHFMSMISSLNQATSHIKQVLGYLSTRSACK